MNTSTQVPVTGEGMTVPHRTASRAASAARYKVDELVLLVVADLHGFQIAVQVEKYIALIYQMGYNVVLVSIRGKLIEPILFI